MEGCEKPKRKLVLSSTQGSHLVKCPFFRKHGGNVICCEGVMDGCSNHVTFLSEKKKKWYMSTYCNARYKYCEYYRMLMQEKYPEE